MPCQKRFTKYYTTRNSPPYPAKECKNLTRKGNDGTFYVSRPNKNNVYRWYKKARSKPKTNKSRYISVLSKKSHLSDKYIHYNIKDPRIRRPRGKKFILFAYEYCEGNRGIFHRLFFDYSANTKIYHEEALEMINNGYKVWVVRYFPPEFEN